MQFPLGFVRRHRIKTEESLKQNWRIKTLNVKWCLLKELFLKDLYPCMMAFSVSWSVTPLHAVLSIQQRNHRELDLPRILRTCKWRALDTNTNVQLFNAPLSSACSSRFLEQTDKSKVKQVTDSVISMLWNVILPDFYFKTGSCHILHGILWAYLGADRKCLLVSRLLERVILCAWRRRRFCLGFRSRDDTRRFHETTFSLKRFFLFHNPLKVKLWEHINSISPEIHYCDTIWFEGAFIFLREMS